MHSILRIFFFFLNLLNTFAESSSASPLPASAPPWWSWRSEEQVILHFSPVIITSPSSPNHHHNHHHHHHLTITIITITITIIPIIIDFLNQPTSPISQPSVNLVRAVSSSHAWDKVRAPWVRKGIRLLEETFFIRYNMTWHDRNKCYYFSIWCCLPFSPSHGCVGQPDATCLCRAEKRGK